MAEDRSLPLTNSHWGAYRVETASGRVRALHPFEQDTDPSPIGQGLIDVVDDPLRITAPMIRKSWLDHGPVGHGRRGTEPFVEVSWETAIGLAAAELERVRTVYGNEAIFAGSYGWASAGRFHHAPGQLKRFMNCIGGFTSSVDTYSFAAGEVIVPHVLGGFREFVYQATSWASVASNTRLLVAFGGVPLKNGQISQGGLGRHRQRDGLRAAADAGVKVVNVSPLRSDIDRLANAEWLAPRPSTDAALLLSLAHTLVEEGLHDRRFLKRYTVGFDRFEAYLFGRSDGVAKSADWAASICDLPAERIKSLARRMASCRTMLSTSFSLTRQDHGEQPLWAAIALASLLGQIGLPGGGITFGYSAMNAVGNDFRQLPVVALPQGRNPVETFIPVARIADMLLNPGQRFDYDGGSYRYPEIRLVYWAGGNPFHHHQDLNRLAEAWQRPDTVIVNDWCWTATARHADIVFPCTTTLERSDIAMGDRDPFVTIMSQVIEPVGESRNDHDIFLALARAMGVGDEFGLGCSDREWTRQLYAGTVEQAERIGITLPAWAELENRGWFEIPGPAEPTVLLADFRRDPDANPLQTPSGRIELFSEVVAGFRYDDCLGHPAWFEPAEWLGSPGGPPLHLISNQPIGKLHSQLDHGSVSRSLKVDGREPVVMHPDDAEERGVGAGDVVRLFNERGSCLAAAVLDDGIRPGVVQMSTGAWYDPEFSMEGKALCKHGNPNVLTKDRRTSRLAQGPTAQSCLVDVERFDGDPPPVTAFEPPPVERPGSSGDRGGGGSVGQPPLSEIDIGR